MARQWQRAARGTHIYTIHRSRHTSNVVVQQSLGLSDEHSRDAATVTGPPKLYRILSPETITLATGNPTTEYDPLLMDSEFTRGGWLGLEV